MKTNLNSTEVEESMIAKQEVDVVNFKNEEMLEREAVERVKQKIEDKNETENDESNESLKSDDRKVVDATSEKIKKFNEWYESQLLVKTNKASKCHRSKEDVTSGQDINAKNDYEKVEIDEDQYKQLFNSKSVDFEEANCQLVPDLLCFLQVYFVLLLMACKTLNGQAEVFSKLSQSPMHLLPCPFQPAPLVTRCQCSCKAEPSCYCVVAASATARSMAKVDMGDFC